MTEVGSVRMWIVVTVAVTVLVAETVSKTGAKTMNELRGQRMAMQPVAMQHRIKVTTAITSTVVCR